MQQSILFKIINTRLFFLAISVFLIFLSVLGGPGVKIFALLSSFNFHEIITLYNNSDSFFRMPDTRNRILVFILSIIFLIISSLNSSTHNESNKNMQYIFVFFSSIFFLSLLITDNLYNISALFLILISIYYYIYKASNTFETIEIYFISGYLLFSIFPFLHSFFITSSIAEVDNYTRFLLAIPLYLMIRDLSFNKEQFLYLINVSAIILLPITLYFSVIESGRVRLFTSSATIVSNIAITLFLFSMLSIYFFKKYNLKYQFMPYIASISALYCWGLSGSRFTLIIPIVILLFVILNNKFRKYISPILNIRNLIFIFILFITIFSSISFDRFGNLNVSSFSDYDKPEANYWMKKDSIVPRLLIWDGSINLIQENTLLGVGLDNFNKELHSQIIDNKIQPIRKDLKNPTAGLNHAHSQYLDIFVKLGFFGFLILLYFIFVNFYFFSKLRNITNDEMYPVFGQLFIFIHSLIMISHVILSHHQSTIFMIFSLMFFGGLSMADKKRGDH